MVGDNGNPQVDRSELSDDQFTDNGSEPEEGQQRNPERIFHSERAGRRVYRQMASTERTIGTKLDALIALMESQTVLLQNFIQTQTGQPVQSAQSAPAPDQPGPGQTVPDPGQIVPAPGQTVPALGQTVPAPDQTVPDPGQIVPAPGQSDPAQTAPPPRRSLPIQDVRFQRPASSTAYNRRTTPDDANTESLRVMTSPTTVSPIMEPPPPATTPAPYKLTGKVPTFSRKALENVRIWLQQMDDLFTAARIPEEDQGNTRTSLTTPHLLDSAKGFYWSLFYANEHRHLSWSRDASRSRTLWQGYDGKGD